MEYKSPEKIKKMFDNIAGKYDFLNEIISLGQHKKIKAAALSEPNITGSALIIDLCCGTGDTARILKNSYPKASVTGVDFSDEMLKIAEKNSNGNINYVNADCTTLPFESALFDMCTISFGLRNIENRQKALLEIQRILKRGGCFVHIDFANSNPLFDFLFNIAVPIAGLIFAGNLFAYSYLIKSKKDFPKPDDLIKEFERKRLKFLYKKDFLFGMISVQYCVKD